jgi:hypothetical protein
MLTAMARELVENKGIGESADSIWRLFREQHNRHYAEFEAMPSEPPAPPESASPPPVKAAVQLRLF